MPNYEKNMNYMDEYWNIYLQYQALLSQIDKVANEIPRTIEEMNPALNAVIHKLYDMGREGAAAVTPGAGPLAGVPFLLKELASSWTGAPLTNATDGGEGVSGLRHSAEVRKAMSATRKGRKHRASTKAKMAASRGGEDNAFFGKKHSEETKRRISETKKANPTNYWAGKTRSEEVRKKISQSLKGKTLGRKMSEEARANMSAAQKLVKKRPPTAETRARLSAAIKESWRKRKQINGDSQ
jgi:hypothetical protein